MGNRSTAITQLFNARLLQTTLLIAGIYIGMGAGWIHVKAELAQLLINHAWQRTLEQPEQNFKPWTWADTQPVARLKLPNNKVWVVLAGAQGNSLAFGPGLAEGSDQPGQGFSVIGGHRDTHFAGLESAEAGQVLAIQNAQGNWIDYRIIEAKVINIDELAIEKQAAEKILLVTCYPFNTVESNPNQRWVVTGERMRF